MKLRRVTTTCPNPKCGGNIADRMVAEGSEQLIYTKCRNCGHVWNASSHRLKRDLSDAERIRLEYWGASGTEQ